MYTPFYFNQFGSTKNCKKGYVCIICLKVPGVRVEVKYIPSHLHLVEEKDIRTLSLSIQNDDEALIKLIFTVFVDILVNR